MKIGRFNEKKVAHSDKSSLLVVIIVLKHGNLFILTLDKVGTVIIYHSIFITKEKHVLDTYAEKKNNFLKLPHMSFKHWH